MPANTNRLPDYTDSRGETIRECSLCHVHLPLTPDNFQHRADTGWIDSRCQTCRRARDREVRRLRREGRGVRLSRRSSGRRFGVEVEFIGDGRQLARMMVEAGLRCEFQGYNHRVQRCWKIVPDGSIDRGYELVSPPLRGEAGLDEVRTACLALAAAGVSVDRTCGLHVHHEATDLNGAALKRLAHGWSRSQPAIDQLVAPSRRNGQYTRNLTTRELNTVDQIPDDAIGDRVCDYLRYYERFRALNFAGFPRYGTVEVRQHQGTTSAEKIIAWVQFGQALIQRAFDADALTSYNSAPAMLADLGSHGLAADQVAYLTRRAERLAVAAPATRRRRAPSAY